MRILLSAALWLMLVLPAAAQFPFLLPDDLPRVVVAGDTLRAPWTGGYNSVIPVQMEFNGDTLTDLFLFDRAGNRITTFLNNGSAGVNAFDYTPQLAALLPPLHDWVRSVDYDCDGDLDLFTYTDSGIGVWRNDFSTGSGLQFTQVTSQLMSWYGSLLNPIFVTQVNMPALEDVDNDGDLDIVTFANSSNYLEYHRNYAIDSLGICNAFKFHLEPYCWGYFKLSGLTNIGILNQNCRAGIVSDEGDNAEQRNRHSGSVLTPIDMGCDGDMDLLNGDLLGQNMLFLENGGTPDSAYITAQDSLFPSYDVPVDLQNLPASYYMDLDNDGKKDLLVAPFATVGEDFENMIFYKNTTDNCSNVFDLIMNRFIAGESVDAGTASNVCFFDVNKDGLKDIVIGNDLYFNANPTLAVSRLSYYRNTGTASQPAFQLVTDDWLGLSGITQYALYPAFGDLDGDGDDDLLLGNSDGTLIQYLNTAGAGNPPAYSFAAPAYQGIDIGNNSMPQIVDVNRDGKPDLLIGERSGVLNYYANTGTLTAPVFTLVTANFGGVNVTPAVGGIAGYSSPVLFDNGNGNGYELLVGSERGQIFHYTNIDGNLGGTFTLADTLYQDILEKKRVTIAVTDIDGDSKFDLLTGCLAGGMRLYTQRLTSSLSETAIARGFTVFPNPAGDFVTIRFNQSAPFRPYTVSLMQLDGRMVYRNGLSTDLMVPTSQLTPGVYILTLSNGNDFAVQKLVKQ